MSDENVCKHFKVGYCKYGLKCRHKHIKDECKITNCNKKCQNRHIKTCRYGPKCKRKNLCQFKHNDKDKYQKIIQKEKEELELLKKEVTELKTKLKEANNLLVNTLNDEEKLKAENIKLSTEIKYLKNNLQTVKNENDTYIKRIHKLENQLEEKRKHHVEKKDTPGNNSNGNHKTRDAKDVDKSPEDIKNYSFVDSISFKCEGGKCDFNSKTKKYLISHITLEHFYNFKSKKYECKTCEKLFHGKEKLTDHIQNPGDCVRIK